MKKTLFTLSILSLLALSTFAQTIRRVNNNSGVTGVNVYTTPQAAHDAAVAGDIIYLEPSVTSYASLTVTKRLTILSNGFNIASTNPNIPFDSRSSSLSGITFDNGSNNSTIMGVRINGIVSVNDLNITVSRCYVSTAITFGRSNNLVLGQYSYGNNATITKNFIYASVQLGNFGTGNAGININLSNNIIYSNISSLTNSVISYNTLYKGSSYFLDYVTGSTISNNIYDARNSSTAIDFVYSGSNNTVSNNLVLGVAGLPSGNGNVDFGTSTATFMVAHPFSSSMSVPKDEDFQLAVGSPAIGIGTGGTNAGAFGGSNPYILSGIAPYPTITNFITSGIGNSTTPLSVSVTVRGNN